jgi:hypothetical protein
MSTPIFETPIGKESSLLRLIDEQKGTTEVEKLPEYFSHVIIVHNSFSDKKLFEKTQNDLPQSANGWNYLFEGKIHYLWSKRRKKLVFQI